MSTRSIIKLSFSKGALLLGLMFLGGTLPSVVMAVVLATGDGTGNTSAPPDDPGFSNVGNRGVYLGDFSGNHWVLTAFHVGSGSITLGGGVYNEVPGSATRVPNPSGSGLSTNTDLLLFRIDSDPSLPNLSISTTVPSIGSSVTLIGDGLDRETSLTSWEVDTSTNPFTWTETAAVPDAQGYESLATRTMRWGTNEITDHGSDTVINVGFGDSRAIKFGFDSGAGADEATLANGDSGGGLFYKNGSNWELTGILQAVGTFSGQPADTAVFGNVAFAGDLSFYRDEILSITAVPEPRMAMLVMALSALSVARLRLRGRFFSA